MKSGTVHIGVDVSKEKLAEAHKAGAKLPEEILDRGENVIYLTLGDPTVYCTFSYLQHIARRIIGSDSGRLIPFCALVGAGFVAVCDLAARMIFAPYELPAGILMSFLGGPFCPDTRPAEQQHSLPYSD